MGNNSGTVSISCLIMIMNYNNNYFKVELRKILYKAKRKAKIILMIFILLIAIERNEK